MSLRLLVVSSAALVLALTPLAHAQTAAAPASPTAPVVAAPAPAVAPVAAAAPAQASSADMMEGKLSYYGRKFNGRKTASGERFNAGALTMAHKTLPFGTMVKVTNLNNKRSVVVRVNDRGPTTEGRVGDLSLAAASKIKMLRSGVVPAKMEVVGKAKSGKAKPGKRKAKKG